MNNRARNFVWDRGDIVVLKPMKKNKLFIQGGPGSGFHGHRGRPGEVGGSQSGTSSPIQEGEDEAAARRERRRQRRRERMEARKPKPPQESQKPFVTKLKSIYQQKVDDIVRKLGYPTEQVEGIEGPGYAFVVDGKTYRSGADYNPNTGLIRIWNIESRSEQAMEGMLAHEIQHSRWNQYQTAYQAQFIEVERSLRSSENPEDWLIDASGSLKSKSDKGRLWAYNINEEFLKDQGRWTRLKKSDGISDYSRAYWRQANNSGSPFDYDRAVDETLAEIARIKTGAGREGDKKAIRPIWQSLYNAVQSGVGVKKNNLFIFEVSYA